jgi:hypothetical protein
MHWIFFLQKSPKILDILGRSRDSQHELDIFPWYVPKFGHLGRSWDCQ